MITCHNWTIIKRRQNRHTYFGAHPLFKSYSWFSVNSCRSKALYPYPRPVDLRCRNSIEIFQDFRCRCRSIAPPNRFSIKIWLHSFLSIETYLTFIIFLKLNDRSDFFSHDVIKSRSLSFFNLQPILVSKRVFSHSSTEFFFLGSFCFVPLVVSNYCFSYAAFEPRVIYQRFLASITYIKFSSYLYKTECTVFLFSTCCFRIKGASIPAYHCPWIEDVPNKKSRTF